MGQHFYRPGNQWGLTVAELIRRVWAEGLPVRDGEHLLIADGAAPFAAAVSRLMACTDLRLALGSAGRLLMEQEFTWHAAWQCLDF